MKAKLNKRSITKLLLDISSIAAAAITAVLLKQGNIEDRILLSRFFLIYSISFIFMYLVMEIEYKSWSYMVLEDIQQIISLNLAAGIFYTALSGYFSAGLKSTFLVIAVASVIIYQLLIRYIFRYMRHIKSLSFSKARNRSKKALIYGAGEAGSSLMKEFRCNPGFPYKITGFLDEDPKKIETYFNGMRVFGNLSSWKQIVSQTGAEIIIIAIPSAGKERIEEILRELEGEDIEVKILPGINEILAEDYLMNQVRDVSIEDLLGRQEIKVNSEGLKKTIENRRILVTGGAGSIGSELARQIAKYNPEKLIVLDINENDAYFLELELKRRYPDLNLVTEIANIREKSKLEILFRKYKPEIVFHAAAHKHVPLMEHNPEEAIKNNIFGTKNMAQCADEYGAERFVLISTDKAVNPTNIMGATKRACELVIEDLNKRSSTRFMAVRFGNVLGSNGSVIPIFKNLIAEGKNLTITHKDITRYFMTIPEAVQLVIEAGSIGEGGEVFILDMGEPVKIMDLARKMIKLSKARVGIDIVGLRPGEKLYEELLYDVSSAIKTENKKIFIAKLAEECGDIELHLENLHSAVKNPDTEELKKLMKMFITSYKEPEHHKRGEENEDDRIVSSQFEYDGNIGELERVS